MRVDLQNYGFVYYIFVGPAKFIGKPINVVSYFWKISELFTRDFLGKDTVRLDICSHVIET